MAFALDRAQQREFRKLLLTIKNNSEKTGLLIVVCDDRNLQAQLIDAYESELEEAGVVPFRVRPTPYSVGLLPSREARAALVSEQPFRSLTPARIWSQRPSMWRIVRCSSPRTGMAMFG